MTTILIAHRALAADLPGLTTGTSENQLWLHAHPQAIAATTGPMITIGWVRTLKNTVEDELVRRPETTYPEDAPNPYTWNSTYRTALCGHAAAQVHECTDARTGKIIAALVIAVFDSEDCYE